MLVKTESIVIRNIRYNDSSIIVQMYTRELGRQSFFVTLSKNRKSAIKAAFFQPMFILNIEADVKQGRELQRIREVHIDTPYSDIPFNIKKNTTTLFLSEMLGKSLQEESQDIDLFDFIKTGMTYFDVLEKNIADFHLAFLIKLTRYLGFGPVRTSSPQEYLDFIEGKFSDHAPVHGFSALNHSAGYFNNCMTLPYNKLNDLQLTNQQRATILEDILTYYKIHLPGFTGLHSLDILREVFK
ncbi:MAG: hypothetical protein A2W91_01100 [Bacteroidetes bacterium GWF2_38_335]|nr:MAG: hypothetical protein A2W91_01100 [Bacteroidetes bacterium GWF2_38_335]OFY80351.1 MAG: hypothetical protein A2281_17610 [Bacteroidetes bacterium RIFOXYA12_FULL_38_20]HBS88847.1 hypothetical protein [Bacteroidales bacterium]